MSSGSGMPRARHASANGPLPEAEQRRLRARLGDVHRDRQVMLPGERGGRTIERTAHGVGRVGGNAEPDALAGERPLPFDPRFELLEADRQLLGVGTENFLIRHARSAQLGERRDHGSRVSRVGHGCHAGGPAGADSDPRGLGVLLGGSPLLQPPDGANPGGKILGRCFRFDPGELEMGVRVDKTGQDRRARENVRRVHGAGEGTAESKARRNDPPIIADQHRPIGDRRGRHGDEPVGGKSNHGRR